MSHFLDFERPLAEMEARIAELRLIAEGGSLDIAEELARLEKRAKSLVEVTYRDLTPWQKCQVARHPHRPRFSSFIDQLIEDYQPLSGDRLFAEDLALKGGLGRLYGRSILILGHERGSDVHSRLKHNFGMARPEGYRKAERLMRLADRFRLPVVSLVDTAGAFPGVDAEARGQGRAIASTLRANFEMSVPFVAAILGEGGSGGAIAIACADKVLMFEHAIYSVISPEGCASILWRSAEKAGEAASALRLVAKDLESLGIIDEVVSEPIGGAHRQPYAAIDQMGQRIASAIDDLTPLTREELQRTRREKFLAMGRKGLAS